MMPRYKKARDKNELQIVRMLKTFGCTVIRSDVIDLIVGRNGINYLLEIKRDDKAPLTAVQKTLVSEWHGKYSIVRNCNDALRAVGVMIDPLDRTALKELDKRIG